MATVEQFSQALAEVRQQLAEAQRSAVLTTTSGGQKDPCVINKCPTFSGRSQGRRNRLQRSLLHHGLAARKRIKTEYQPDAAGRHTAMLMGILQHGWDSRGAANTLERRIQEYGVGSLETFSDGMKIAVLASHAPSRSGVGTRERSGLSERLQVQSSQGQGPRQRKDKEYKNTPAKFEGDCRHWQERSQVGRLPEASGRSERQESPRRQWSTVNSNGGSGGKPTLSGAEVKFGSKGSWVDLHTDSGVQRVPVRVKGKSFGLSIRKTDAWIIPENSDPSSTCSGGAGRRRHLQSRATQLRSSSAGS